MSYRLDGYEVISGVVGDEELRRIGAVLETAFAASTRLALRHEDIAAMSQLVRCRVAAVLPIIAGAQCISCHYFNKCDDENWMVPLHRDEYFICNEHVRAGDAAVSTIKEGERFGLYPFPLLRRIIAVRVAIDRISQDNGPLRVIPRSDGEGFVPSDLDRGVEVLQEPGDALIMSPLIYHASGRIAGGGRRRVLHFAYLCV